MTPATFTRRWFLRATATATVALVAAKVLPVSAVPRDGELHNLIRSDVIAWIREAWNAHVRAYGKPPKWIQLGPAAFAAYEGALEANMRLSPADSFGYALYFKGAPVSEAPGYAPWQINLINHHQQLAHERARGSL